MQEVGLLTKGGLRHLPRLFKMWKHKKLVGPCEKTRRLENRCREIAEWGELVQTNVPIKACTVWDTVKAVRKAHFATVGSIIPKNIKFAVQALALGEKRTKYTPMIWDDPAANTDQKLSQYWFAGNHSNVGGGNNDMTLANITLAWMIGQLTSEIQFNQRQIWAITTTREWSKPSPENDKEITKAEESSPDSRN